LVTNDILEAIEQRRSIRKFKPTLIDDERMEAVLNAGRWAPSFMNTQPCRFIVVSRGDVKRQIIDALHMPFLGVDYKGPLPYTDLMEAPAIIVICADTGKDRLHYIEDAACVTQNMALAAHSVRLGAYWIGVFNHTYLEDAVKKALNIPDNVRIVSLLPIGEPAEFPTKDRASLEELVHYEKYGNRTP
jgi:nitroreductase